ncbi:MAG: hypothetical protein Ct9H300mP1_21000 [Planctomycetaceae bacterium]|nr:MAG: hypothetical protein Ct9H300mP1_21000 [Planctomycetaceae bacterium]
MRLGGQPIDSDAPGRWPPGKAIGFSPIVSGKGPRRVVGAVGGHPLRSRARPFFDLANRAGSQPGRHHRMATAAMAPIPGSSDACRDRPGRLRGKVRPTPGAILQLVDARRLGVATLSCSRMINWWAPVAGPFVLALQAPPSAQTPGRNDVGLVGTTHRPAGQPGCGRSRNDSTPAVRGLLRTRNAAGRRPMVSGPRRSK